MNRHVVLLSLLPKWYHRTNTIGCIHRQQRAQGTKAVSAAMFIAAGYLEQHACPSEGHGLSTVGRDFQPWPC